MEWIGRVGAVDRALCWANKIKINVDESTLDKLQPASAFLLFPGVAWSQDPINMLLLLGE